MNQSDLPGWALTLKVLLEEVEEAKKGKGTPLQSDTTPETAEVPPDG